MKLIDLSHPLNNLTSTYPSDPDISIIREKNIDTDNTLLHSFKMGTHSGTHLDAPAHIINDGKTIDKFLLSHFSGTTIKVDKNTYNYLDYIDFAISGVIYDTGWYKKFNNSEIFYGSDRPEIPIELIKKLKKNKINFFGCDLPSVDCSGSKEKIIHNALLGENIIIYETLANLDRLPSKKPFEFYGFPLPIENLDGSPVRAVACI